MDELEIDFDKDSVENEGKRNGNGVINTLKICHDETEKYE
jgi:hypothetical protein